MIFPAQSSVEDQPKMFMLVHIFYYSIIKVQRRWLTFLFVNTIDFVWSRLKLQAIGLLIVVYIV